MNYIVISSRDGDVDIEQLTKSELEIRLDKNYYGRRAEEHFPKDNDLVAIDGLYIIQGNLVIPKKVEVVTKYELPEE